MSDVCPSCENIFGELYLTCKWCGVRYCEKCIDPKKHYCPSFREEPNKIDTPTKVNHTTSPEEVCKKFAEEYTENKEEVPSLPRSKIIKLVAKGDGILDDYICPRCLNVRDVDRYACVHCRNDRNQKCEWCGNHFCKDCIEPVRHECAEYENKMKKLSYVKPSIGLVEPTPIPTSINNAVIKPTIEPEPVIKLVEPTPIPTPIDNAVIEHTTEPLMEPEPLVKREPVQFTQPKPMEEAVKVENKTSLWKRLLSIFGFGK